MSVNGEQANVLAAFLELLTMGGWPAVLRTFRDEMGYEPEELLEAWTALCDQAGVDRPEPDDFILD